MINKPAKEARTERFFATIGGDGERVAFEFVGIKNRCKSGI